MHGRLNILLASFFLIFSMLPGGLAQRVESFAADFLTYEALSFFVLVIFIAHHQYWQSLTSQERTPLQLVSTLVCFGVFVALFFSVSLGAPSAWGVGLVIVLGLNKIWQLVSEYQRNINSDDYQRWLIEFAIFYLIYSIYLYAPAISGRVSAGVYFGFLALVIYVENRKVAE
ncbi:hypothetical protein BVY02_01525 [bacterium J17]|nr:hypothetical protein BVY02_01525 [bacterium J17]